MYVERAGSSAATSSGRSAPGGQLPHDHRVHVRAVEAPGRGEHLGDPVGDRLGSALSGELLDGPRLREQIRSCEPSHTSCLGMVQHLSPPIVAAARSRRPALAGRVGSLPSVAPSGRAPSSAGAELRTRGPFPLPRVSDVEGSTVVRRAGARRRGSGLCVLVLALMAVPPGRRRSTCPCTIRRGTPRSGREA